MRRIMLCIEYDGTDYCGWQRQTNGISVQEVLEGAVLRATGETVSIVGSGRTDSGVHAFGQVAHFDTECSIPAEKIAAALNVLLPDDVKVLYSREAAQDFNARFSAKRKTYLYKIYADRIQHPIYRRGYCQIRTPLDAEKMQQAAQYLLGTHYFDSFMASGSTVKDTCRTLYALSVKETAAMPQIVEIEVTGNGFLYNMVRIIAGTLVAVGNGEIQPKDVEQILESRKRDSAGKTLPACGLYLKSVEYTE